MPALVHDGFALALVLVLPGLLLILALGVPLTIVEWLALAPACSLGVVYVVAEFVTLVGAPLGPATFFVMVAALAIAALRRVRHGWSRPVIDRVDGDDDHWPGARRPSVLIALGLLVMAMLIGSITWLRPMQGRALAAPGSDAMIHGFMIRRIADTESINPRDVLVMDTSGRNQAKEYYPISLHASLAIAYRTTGAAIGHLLNAAIVFFAALVFPVSLFALTRHLVPKEPLAAGFSAVIGSLITMFPYGPMRWGLIPLIVGMTLVPITVLLVMRTVDDAWSPGAAGLAGLVLAGGFALHNSEVPLILGLVVISVVFLGAPRVGWRDVLTRLSWIGVIAAVLLAPTLLQIVAGGGERHADRVEPGGHLGSVKPLVPLDDFVGRLVTLGESVPQRQGWLVVFAVAGIGVLLWRRQLTPWILAALLIVLLAILGATSYNSITNTLTFPWYRDFVRLGYNVVLFVAVFGGVLLGFGARWVAQRVSSKAGPLLAAAIVMFAVLYATSAAQALRVNRDMVTRSYTAEQPVRPTDVAAFKFMRDHSRQGDSVLSDLYIDGATWMYPLAGINPVFGITGEGEFRTRAWTDRLYLHDHIAELGDNKRVDDIVRRLRVRFVYFGEQNMKQLGPHVFTLDMLRSAPHLRQVFDQDGAHVFAITLPQ